MAIIPTTERVQVGVWKLKEVNDVVMGGYWRVLSNSGWWVYGGGFSFQLQCSRYNSFKLNHQETLLTLVDLSVIQEVKWVR